MNLITIENLTKNYTERMLFDDTAFSLNEGEKVGVIGINGTGKSTLLKIAAGLEEPDSGTVTRGRNLQIRYLPQTPAYDPEETVLHFVTSKNRRPENEWTLESDAKSMLNKLGITGHEMPMGHLSGGQRKRAALAGVLLSQADVLILDEPTNHLDSGMAEWLEDYLQKTKAAVIMVTHDRYFLDSVVNRIVEIDHGKIYSYDANYLGFLELKAEREAIEDASERKRQSILRTEIAWMQRGARARSTKQKAHIERYETLRDMRKPERDGQVEMSSMSSRLGNTTIEWEHIGKSYGDRLLIRDFTYILLKGDRLGIIGENGCGKTTLLRMITGLEKPDTGTIVTGQTVKIGYFSQENEHMDPTMRMIDYVREGAEYIRTKDGLVSASVMLDRFLFPPQMQYTRIEKLSGGEKRRLYLLRILMESPNVLILDEPTNDLDIKTLTILEDYLDGFDGIVITVSHDRYFLDRVVSRIFAFEGGGTVRQYEGGYSDYYAAKLARDGEEGAAANAFSGAANAGSQEKQKTERTKREQKLRFSYKEAKEWETIEGDIEALETRSAEIDDLMQQSAADYGKLRKLQEEKDEVEEKLLEKMERWEYLSELNEKIQAENS